MLTRRTFLAAAVTALPAATLLKRRRPHTSDVRQIFFRRSSTAASSKKVFPHYFGQLPRSLDNRSLPDYYDSSLLRVAGEGGRHAAYGGYLRDRPLPRPPVAGDFMLEDAKWEIRTARAIGVDGFFVNITSLEGGAWNRYLKLVEAVEVLRTPFYIVPMIDTNGAVRKASAAAISEALGAFIGRRSTYLERGKLMLSCFKCEGFSTERWLSIFSAIRARHHIEVTFAGILLNPNEGNISTYAPIADYLGNWIIGADPKMLASTTNTAGRAAGWARAAGCKWVGTSHTQINVPYTGHYFDEAANSAALRASWRKIYDQEAEHVQCVTWCDFSEGGQLVPSVAKGWSQAAITAYYIERYKTGHFPRITKDVLFLSHRDQPLTGARYQSGQFELMQQAQRSAMTPPQDRVEALTYLTAPAQVTVTIGGKRYTYAAPAGEHSRTFPNALGNIDGQLIRAGRRIATVSSPFPVTARPVSQDRQYFFVSSLDDPSEQRHRLVHL